MNEITVPYRRRHKIELAYSRLVPGWIDAFRRVYNYKQDLSEFYYEGLMNPRYTMVADIRNMIQLERDPTDICDNCSHLIKIFQDIYKAFQINRRHQGYYYDEYYESKAPQVVFHDYYIEALQVMAKHFAVKHKALIGPIEVIVPEPNHSCLVSNSS